MPKTSTATTRRKPVTVKDVEQRQYVLSSRFLRDDIFSDGETKVSKTSRYYLKLADLKVALESENLDGFEGVTLHRFDGVTLTPISYPFELSYIPSKKVSIDGFSSHKYTSATLSIGCRGFQGRAASRIVAAAKRAKLAKAATA